MRIVVLPPVPALLPRYGGRVDPVPDLRRSCRAAVSWLLEGGTGPVGVLADPPDAAARSRGVVEPLGVRVARDLLEEAGYRGPLEPDSHRSRVLVLANGSARRGIKAPGHLDPRSFAYDETVESALATGDRAALGALDAGLGGELLAVGMEQLRGLAARDLRVDAANLRYAGDPYGVRYWVAEWDVTPTG